MKHQSIFYTISSVCAILMSLLFGDVAQAQVINLTLPFVTNYDDGKISSEYTPPREFYGHEGFVVKKSHVKTKYKKRTI